MDKSNAYAEEPSGALPYFLKSTRILGAAIKSSYNLTTFSALLSVEISRALRACKTSWPSTKLRNETAKQEFEMACFGEQCFGCSTRVRNGGRGVKPVSLQRLVGTVRIF